MTLKFNPAAAAAIVVAAVACSDVSAREAADFFAEAPQSVIPVVDRNSRLDMLDYFRSGLTTTTANLTGNRSSITALSPQSVTLDISSSTTVQLALIPVKNDTIVAVIETVSTPAEDSSIKFFTTSWQELPTPALPAYKDFILPASRKKAAGCEAPSMFFTKAAYDETDGSFIFTDTSAAHYYSKEKPEVFSFMTPEIRMRYTGKKFIPAK